MAGAIITDIHAGSRSFSNAHGLRTGLFVRLLSNERFILRAKLGAAGVQGKGDGYGETSGKWSGHLYLPVFLAATTSDRGSRQALAQNGPVA